MLHNKQLKGLFLVFVVFFISVNIKPASGITIYTAHVKWEAYNMSAANDCGDGVGNTCEDALRVKRTTSTTSCSGRTWNYGSYQSVSPMSSYDLGFYELTWSNSGSAPCLTFDVRFYENSAGYATSQKTYTIASDETHSFAYLSLIIGSANGDFRISFWLTIEGSPYE